MSNVLIRRCGRSSNSLLGSKTAVANGTYQATTDNLDGYSSVVVNVPAPTPALQEKTATVNGDVTPDTGYVGMSKVVVNVSGGGDQPQLHAPSIALSGTSINISNPSTNGNYVTGYKVYMNDSLLLTTANTSIDVSDEFVDEGTYTFYVKSYGTDFEDSPASNTVSYTVYPPSAVSKYAGTITPLANGKTGMFAAVAGGYAIIAGGYQNGVDSDTAETYNASLTHGVAPALSAPRRSGASTSIGNYALFGGGIAYSGAYKNTVDAYDSGLTRTTPTALSSGKMNLAATSNANYALFGGGNNSNLTAVVEAYDSSLTKTLATSLPTACTSLAATRIGDYAVFAGGGNSAGYSPQSQVTAYDDSLTKVETSLSARSKLAAASNANYAIFAGGYQSRETDKVDAFSASLTRTIATVLSAAREYLRGTTVGYYCLFGGGSPSSMSVDAYDTSLTRSVPTALSVARTSPAAVTIGDYALFTGNDASVDAYYTN